MQYKAVHRILLSTAAPNVNFYEVNNKWLIAKFHYASWFGAEIWPII